MIFSKTVEQTHYMFASSGRHALYYARRDEMKPMMKIFQDTFNTCNNNRSIKIKKRTSMATNRVVSSTLIKNVVQTMESLKRTWLTFAD